jgi:2-dehydro-3-deoxy-D-arabinonate dehydratase
MKLGQIQFEGHTVAAIFETGRVRPIPGYTTVELIHRAETESMALPALAAKLASHHAVAAAPLIPLRPAEVWACGCTYETSAIFRDAEHGTREGMYAYVYRNARPEIFFKGTARVCVGPGEAIGLRADSKFTAPEPELALILGSHGAILGFTLANDVSAWDIERENALYLPQSKVYSACCSLGPVIVTADELSSPYKLAMTCTITRGGTPIFQGEVSTARLHRKLENLVDYLLRANAVPAASVLLTGTGIIVTEEAALAPGDTVFIRIPEIGELSNPAVIVG